MASPGVRERLERWMSKLELQYRWAQKDGAVIVTFPLPKSIPTANVEVEFTADSLVAGIKGQPPVVAGRLFAAIDPSESVWTVEQDESLRILVISLEKCEKEVEWPTLMHDGPLDNLDAQSVCYLGAYREATMNYPGALECYLASAERGNSEAMLRLAYIYAVGQEQSQFPVEADATKAFEYNLKAAEKDCVEAQYFVARSYQHGFGAPVDYVSAAHWYELALQMLAIGGQTGGPLYVSALFDLGVLHHHGRHGLERNIQRALALWAMADNVGSAEAAYNIAVCCIKGDGIPASLDDATLYFQKAAARDPKLKIPSRQEINNVRLQAGLPPFPMDTPSSAPAPTSSSPSSSPKRVHFAQDVRDPAPHRLHTPPPPPTASASPRTPSRLRNVVSANQGSDQKKKEKRRKESEKEATWGLSDYLWVGGAVAAVVVVFAAVRARNQ